MYTCWIMFDLHDVPSRVKEAQDSSSPDRQYSPQDSGGSNVLSPSIVAGDLCSPKSIYCLAEKAHPAFLLGDVITNRSFLRLV